MRLALECRRRVKEQQKRIGAAEFRNTQFSYSMGLDGVEKFVVDARAAERGQHRPRPAAARPGLGDQPRRPRRGSQGCTGSRSPKARAAASAS